MSEKLSASQLSERYQALIIAELRNGPRSAAELAERIGHAKTSISQYLRVLEKADWVYRAKWVHRAGRGSYRIWGLNHSKIQKPAPIKKSEIGLTDEDYQWLSYWRLPRAVRRQQAEIGDD